MIKLGSKVRDLITGFDGIATGRSDYLYGCSQICISPDRLGKDGETLEGTWFDDQRVELVETREVPVSKASVAQSGGPQSNAPPAR